MPSPLSLLHKYGIRPRKRLGQCFLCDVNILEKIIGIADVRERDTVVEIGAGIGVLTDMLAARAHRVVALEVDRHLVELLRNELAARGNVEIIQADVLQFDFSDVHRDDESERAAGGLTVVGNVPYNISSQIVLRLLDYRKSIRRIVLMLQREVAERLAAGPGTKDYGPLSVYVALYTEARLEHRVPATCFHPRPDVDSRILKMDVRVEPLCRVDDPVFFRCIVRASFAMRRKTLLNNLRSSRLALAPERIDKAMEALGIDGRRRAETLSVKEFADLSNILGRT